MHSHLNAQLAEHHRHDLLADAQRQRLAASAPRSPMPRRALLIGVVVAIVLMAIPLVASAPPADAAFPGANGKIAFTSSRDNGIRSIYVMDADGTDQTRLTAEDDILGDVEPAWSPDGTQIAFTRLLGSGPAIFVMDADGANQTQLTDSGDFAVEPAWSPDGSRIAFTAADSPQGRGIFVMDADGTNQTQLTAPDSDDFSEPAWSPDGTQIAFTRRPFPSNNWEIFVMDADGANPTQLTGGEGRSQEPAWSPDGTRIAFRGRRDGNQEIFVMDADGTNTTPLTDNSSFDFEPAWSPDGTQVAFRSTVNDNRDIYVIDADGTGLTRLTSDDAFDEAPAWQPVAPSATDDHYTSVPRTEEFVSPNSVLDNDQDGDWIVEVVDTSSLGEVEMDPDGSFTYQLSDPATEESTDVFTYRACATAVLCSTPATVTLELEELAPSPEGPTTLDASPAEYKFLFLSVAVSAQLSAADTGDPLPGQTIVFRAGATYLCSDVTDTAGNASCSAGIVGAISAFLQGAYQASFAGNDSYLPSTTSAPA